jgi:hypothetical protein
MEKDDNQEILSAISGLETRMDAKISGLETRMDTKITDAISGLETRMDTKITDAISGLETRMDTKITELETKTDTRFNDLVEVIGEFSNKVDERFDRVEVRLESVEKLQENIKTRVSLIDSQQVTKAFFDDKLIGLKADLRKRDRKLENLTHLLSSKKVISESDANNILVA